MALTWQHDAVELMRVMLDDMDEDNLLYSESKITRILVVAAYTLAAEVTFTQDYTIDISQQLITPDPTDYANSTDDANFVNLMCLKAACIISRGAAIKAAGKAVAGSDMNAVKFDLRGVADSTLKLLEKGWCAVYNEVLNDYIYGSGTMGRAVMSPFRTYARGYTGGIPYYGNPGRSG